MSPDPVSWPIYILILLIVMVSNGLVSAALNALDSVDRNKLNEIEEDECDICDILHRLGGYIA